MVWPLTRRAYSRLRNNSSVLITVPVGQLASPQSVHSIQPIQSLLTQNRALRTRFPRRLRPRVARLGSSQPGSRAGQLKSFTSMPDSWNDLPTVRKIFRNQADQPRLRALQQESFYNASNISATTLMSPIPLTAAQRHREAAGEPLAGARSSPPKTRQRASS